MKNKILGLVFISVISFCGFVMILVLLSSHQKASGLNLEKLIPNNPNNYGQETASPPTPTGNSESSKTTQLKGTIFSINQFSLNLSSGIENSIYFAGTPKVTNKITGKEAGLEDIYPGDAVELTANNFKEITGIFFTPAAPVTPTSHTGVGVTKVTDSGVDIVLRKLDGKEITDGTSITLLKSSNAGTKVLASGQAKNFDYLLSGDKVGVKYHTKDGTIVVESITVR